MRLSINFCKDLPAELAYHALVSFAGEMIRPETQEDAFQAEVHNLSFPQQLVGRTTNWS